MEKRIKPSDIKKLAEICKQINKSLSFENPIIEGKKLTRETKRFQKLFEYSIPDDEKREGIKEKKEIGDNKYEDIAFLNGQEAEEALDILQNEGEDEAMEYLKHAYHYPNEHQIKDHPGTGTSDTVYEKDGYIMSYNRPLGYIGLVKKV